MPLWTYFFLFFFSRCENEYLTVFDYLSAAMSNAVPKLKTIVQAFLDKELLQDWQINLECTHTEHFQEKTKSSFTDSGIEFKEQLNASVGSHTLVGQVKFCGEINELDDGLTVQSNNTQQVDHSRLKNFSTEDCVVGLCKFKVKQEAYKIGCFLWICLHQYTNSKKDDNEFACFIRNEQNKHKDTENVNPIVVKWD